MQGAHEPLGGPAPGALSAALSPHFLLVPHIGHTDLPSVPRMHLACLYSVAHAFPSARGALCLCRHPASFHSFFRSWLKFQSLGKPSRTLPQTMPPVICHNVRSAFPVRLHTHPSDGLQCKGSADIDRQLRKFRVVEQLAGGHTASAVAPHNTHSPEIETVLSPCPHCPFIGRASSLHSRGYAAPWGSHLARGPCQGWQTPC